MRRGREPRSRCILAVDHPKFRGTRRSSIRMLLPATVRWSMSAVREEREAPPPPGPIRARACDHYRMKKPGPHAAPPILTGGRGLVCSDFFGFGGAGAAAVPTGETDADGVSP